MTVNLSCYMNKLGDVANKEVAKNTQFNKLNTKVNNLGKTTPGVNPLIHINQYKTDGNLEKKFGDVDKKIPDVSGLVTTIVLDTKIKEVDNKISELSSLIQKKKKKDYDSKISEIDRGKTFY